MALKRLPGALLLFSLALGLMTAGSKLQRDFGQVHNQSRDVDFVVYFFAGQTVHDAPRGELYAGAFDGNPQLKDAPVNSPLAVKARTAGFPSVMMYLYPPLAADLFVPLWRLSPSAASVVWRLINLALVLLSCGILARMLAMRIMSAEFVVLMVAAYSFFPIVEAIDVGQVTILMLLLWAVGVAAYGEGAMAVSACAIALATVLKVTPLLIVPLMLIWWERRWLVTYAAAVGALVLAMGTYNGWHTLRESVTVLAAMGGGISWLDNKCIASLIEAMYFRRYFAHDVVTSLPPALTVVSKVASLGFYAWCLYLVWRQRKVSTRAQRATLMAVFALVVLLSAPVTWRHGYAIALLPLTLLWAQALRERNAGLRTWLLTFATVSIGTVFFDVVAAIHIPAILRLAAGSMWTLSGIALCTEVLLRGTAANATVPSPVAP